MASKSKLNELVQKRALGLPVYITNSREDGFTCDLTIGKQKFKSEQVHSKKKAAEDDVAAVALCHFTAESSDQPASQQASYTARSTGNSDIKTNKPAVVIPTLTQREITAHLNKTTREVSPSNQGDKPSEQLQDYCCSQGWTEPIYNLKTVGGKQATCGVLVHGKLYSYDDAYSSDEAAKQETARRVLAKLTSPKLVDNTTTNNSFPATKQSHPVTAQLSNDVEKMTITNPLEQEPSSNGTSSSPVDDKPKVSDKNMLQHLCHKKGLPPPEYTTEYPPGTVGYISEVMVDGKSFRSSVQGSKKVAEAAAAREAIKYLSSDTTLKAASPAPLKMSGNC